MIFQYHGLKRSLMVSPHCTCRSCKASKPSCSLPSTEDGWPQPPSYFYKRLQVLWQSQLLTSPDACVRQMAEKTIQNDLTLQRSKFKANVIVRDVMVGNPDFTRKSLLNGAISCLLKKTLMRADTTTC